MKLYDSVGPNPRIVRMFMAEKGIEMPKQAVDLRKGENREAEHLEAQSAWTDADAGARQRQLSSRRSPRSANISKRRTPRPPMVGATPEERAECRMWTRRIDLNICEPSGQRLPLRRRR